MRIELSTLKTLQAEVKKGEQQAFRDLYRLFFARLHNFAILYVHSRETGEEIVNDIMVRLWEKRDGIEDIENLETYLFAAVRNHSLNHIEKFSRLKVVADVDSGKVEILNTHDPERMLEWKEISHRLNQEIEKMPDQCRTVFKLIKEEGFRYKQVAEILGISVRTVETQLFRAIRKLDAVVSTFVPERPRKRNNGSILLFLMLLFICH